MTKARRTIITSSEHKKKLSDTGKILAKELRNLNNFPELQVILWDIHTSDIEYNKDLLNLYETRWSFVDESKLLPNERLLIESLVKDFGGGVLLCKS